MDKWEALKFWIREQIDREGYAAVYNSVLTQMDEMDKTNPTQYDKYAQCKQCFHYERDSSTTPCKECIYYPWTPRGNKNHFTQA